MPDLPAGGVLLRVLYLSLDPRVLDRMDERRSNAKPLGIGEAIAGEGVSEVIASDSAAYAIGDLVLSSTGWRTHVASDGTGLHKLDCAFASVTTALGVLGTPGFAAYSGITLIGKPRVGETVVVAAASDPVGSSVGQLAKMAGARAVGIASGLEKCRYLERELGFDAAIVHDIPGLAERLAQACPDGIDVYFEKVGGPIWHAVLPLLNRFARVPVCSLSTQHGGAAENGNGLMDTMREVLNKSLTVRGFTNEEFADAHYPQFLQTVSGGIARGQIHYREDITEGLENAPKAFVDMLEGRNVGTALVRVAQPAPAGELRHRLG
jgi:NADPH-dependent curcumin reductase CurA